MKNKSNDKRSLWIRPIVQTLVVVGVPVLVYFFKLGKRIRELLSTEADSILGVAVRLALDYGDIAAACVVFILLLFFLRSKNKDKIVNRYPGYHKKPYFIFLYCAKILNYGACDLILVPCEMQFKLVIRKVFRNYLMYESISEDKSKPCVSMPKEFTNTVNILIADTYPIELEEIPESVANYSAIRINRTSNFDKAKYKNEKFINKVISIVNNLPSNVDIINVFSTLNPNNAYEIIRKAFDKAGRTNIKHLYVFSQEHSNNKWNYSEKGTKIY